MHLGIWGTDLDAVADVALLPLMDRGNILGAAEALRSSSTDENSDERLGCAAI